MVVRLSPDLEKIVKEKAELVGKSADEIVDATLRQALLPTAPQPTSTASADTDDWVRRLRSIASPAGVWLTDEQLSRENLYED